MHPDLSLRVLLLQEEDPGENGKKCYIC
jgi:hypothetical protein